MNHMVDEARARAAYAVLVEEVGAEGSPEEVERFVHSVTSGMPSGEYRFRGTLGRGGKFLYGESHGPIPRVGCYEEDLDEVRMAAIAAADARLRPVFETGDTA